MFSAKHSSRPGSLPSREHSLASFLLLQFTRKNLAASLDPWIILR